jgi:hypothetical protein
MRACPALCRTGQLVDVEFLLVGGGGGAGAAWNNGSGGGAGGRVVQSIFTPTPNTDYSIVIGPGGLGTADSPAPGNPGSPTTAFGFSAQGGGPSTSSTTSVTPPSGGNTGGIRGRGGSSDASTPTNAVGAPGVLSSITGTAVRYAPGGGAGQINWDDPGATNGQGGADGGGNGGNSDSPGGNAMPNTGGGGGGAGGSGSGAPQGGNGGSGVAVVRYFTDSMTATGGTITTSGPYTIHRFTSNGIFRRTS